MIMIICGLNSESYLTPIRAQNVKVQGSRLEILGNAADLSRTQSYQSKDGLFSAEAILVDVCECVCDLFGCDLCWFSVRAGSSIVGS